MTDYRVIIDDSNLNNIIKPYLEENNLIPLGHHYQISLVTFNPNVYKLCEHSTHKNGCGSCADGPILIKSYFNHVKSVKRHARCYSNYKLNDEKQNNNNTLPCQKWWLAKTDRNQVRRKLMSDNTNNNNIQFDSDIQNIYNDDQQHINQQNNDNDDNQQHIIETTDEPTNAIQLLDDLKYDSASTNNDCKCSHFCDCLLVQCGCLYCASSDNSKSCRSVSCRPAVASLRALHRNSTGQITRKKTIANLKLHRSKQQIN